MKIEVIDLYKGEYDKAYLYVNQDKRKRVSLFSNTGKSKWISYARYLWEEHNGKIPDGYEVDHINNDKTELQNSLEEKTKENALLAAKIRNSEKDTERLNMFESAINEMLNSIGWDVNTNKQTENIEHKNRMHRMGDNQVVDFNIGM